MGENEPFTILTVADVLVFLFGLLILLAWFLWLYISYCRFRIKKGTIYLLLGVIGVFFTCIVLLAEYSYLHSVLIHEAVHLREQK